jgi:hypothetical protein
MLKQRIKTLEAELANCKCKKQKPLKEESLGSQGSDLYDSLFVPSSFDEWEDGHSEGGTDEETHIEQLLVPTKYLIVGISFILRFGRH